MKSIYSAHVIGGWSAGGGEKPYTKQLVNYLSNKWDRSYLAAYGYVQSHISLELVWDLNFLEGGSNSGVP